MMPSLVWISCTCCSHPHVVCVVGAEGFAHPGMLVDDAHQEAPTGEAAMGDTQRLSDTEQLEILALLEAVSTERSPIRAARALAELMRHLQALGQRIAGELSDQNRDIKPARR
jgi:hypothetical protein